MCCSQWRPAPSLSLQASSSFHRFQPAGTRVRGHFRALIQVFDIQVKVWPTGSQARSHHSGLMLGQLSYTMLQPTSPCVHLLNPAASTRFHCCMSKLCSKPQKFIGNSSGDPNKCCWTPGKCGWNDAQDIQIWFKAAAMEYFTQRKCDVASVKLQPDDVTLSYHMEKCLLRGNLR